MVKVTKMIKRHLDRLVTAPDHELDSQRFNSRIQSPTSEARGFRNFGYYRTRIPFFCGHLRLQPQT